QFWTGARPSETIALRWGKIDFLARTIRIRASRVLGEDSRTKTGRSRRDVIMHEPVEEVLRAIRPTRPSPEAFVFVTPAGCPIDEPNFYRREWVPLLTRLGVRQRPFYNCRHTYITTMLDLTGN